MNSRLDITAGRRTLSDVLSHWRRLSNENYLDFVEIVGSYAPLVVPEPLEPKNWRFEILRRRVEPRCHAAGCPHLDHDFGQVFIEINVHRAYRDIIGLVENDLFDVGNARPLFVLPFGPVMVAADGKPGFSEYSVVITPRRR